MRESTRGEGQSSSKAWETRRNHRGCGQTNDRCCRCHRRHCRQCTTVCFRFLTCSAELKKQVLPRLVRPGGATAAAIAEDDDAEPPPTGRADGANDNDDADDIDKLLLPFLCPPPFFLPPPPGPPPPLDMPVPVCSSCRNKERRRSKGRNCVGVFSVFEASLDALPSRRAKRTRASKKSEATGEGRRPLLPKKAKKKKNSMATRPEKSALGPATALVAHAALGVAL